jgi:hypothetical protein
MQNDILWKMCSFKANHQTCQLLKAMYFSLISKKICDSTRTQALKLQLQYAEDNCIQEVYSGLNLLDDLIPADSLYPVNKNNIMGL